MGINVNPGCVDLADHRDHFYRLSFRFTEQSLIGAADADWPVALQFIAPVSGRLRSARLCDVHNQQVTPGWYKSTDSNSVSYFGVH